MQCRWCSRSQSPWIRKKETSPIFRPSKIVAGQQKQNANNDEDEFKNIFPLHRKYTAAICIATKRRKYTGFLHHSWSYQDEPCCSRDFCSPSNGHKVFCQFCNNAFSINAIQEHADLCLEGKTKFCLEKHTETSDDGELLNITQNVLETNYHQILTKIFLRY